jgi:hypothetical protein
MNAFKHEVHGASRGYEMKDIKAGTCVRTATILTQPVSLKLLEDLRVNRREMFASECKLNFIYAASIEPASW